MPVKKSGSVASIAQKIARLKKLVDSQNKAKIAQGFGKMARDCFNTKKDPYGRPWAAPKGDNPNPDQLRETGAMERKTQGVVRGGRIVVESKDPKSKFHLNRTKRTTKRGTVTRPARRWLPLPGRYPAAWSKFAKSVVTAKFWQTIR